MPSAPRRRALLGLATLAGCGAMPDPPADRPAGALVEHLHVAVETWHADVCLAAERIAPGPLAALVTPLPPAAYYAFGFGLRDWLLAERPGSGEALAALGSGPAMVFVRPLGAPPPEVFGPEKTVALALPAGGHVAIAGFIIGQLPAPPTAERQFQGSWLFPSTLRYSTLFTCNTWVMQALRLAGLPVPVAGVVLASQAMVAARREAARQAAA